MTALAAPGLLLVAGLLVLAFSQDSETRAAWREHRARSRRRRALLP